MKRSKRILGIDPGERRIGLAVSDDLGFTAQGLETFDARDDGNFLDVLSQLLDRYDVGCVVLGHPVSMSGRTSRASKDAERLAQRIRERFSERGVDVVMWDERLTSAEARRTLRGSRAGKGAVDRISAVLILQGYLDSQREVSP